MSSTGQVLWLALVLAAAGFGSSAAPARALTSFAGCPAAVGNTKLPANLAPSCLSYQCNPDGTVSITVSKSCGWSNILILGANNQCIQRLENGGGSTTFTASCGTSYTIWIKDGSYNGKGANNYQGGALPDTFCSVPPALANLQQWCEFTSWTPDCGAAPNKATNCPAPSGPCEYAAPTTSPCVCPTIMKRPSTFVCRAAAGPCDVPETCTGSSASCPADSFASSSTVCRGSAGPCDVPETCTGSSASCPADSFAPSTLVCRGSAGPCDVPETCTGSSAGCPADSFAPSTTVCRGSAGPCDVPETCTGSSATCPSDCFVAVGTVCRGSVGPCDVAEVCTGSSAACPPNGFASSTTTCDMWGTKCTGSSATCPMMSMGRKFR